MASFQGRSYRGFGGFGRTPPRAGKGPPKMVFFLFLFFFIFFYFFLFKRDRTRRKASSLKSTKGRRQQKTSHARRAMARLTFEWHFAQTPSLPKKPSRRPTCKTRRGQVRMPNAVLSISFFKVEDNSLELTRIFKESFKDQR